MSLNSNKHQEHILAVHAESLIISGVWTQSPIANENVILAQRKGLETNAKFRQILPYTLVRDGNSFGAYRRTPKGNEARLHGHVSIGFGGHVDCFDLVYDDSGVLNIDATIYKSASREITEELTLDHIEPHQFTKLDLMIASSETEVDSVHLGILNIIDANREDVLSREDALNFMGFYTIEQLALMPDLESWSRIVVDSIMSKKLLLK